MKTTLRVIVVAAVIVAAGGILYAKRDNSGAVPAATLQESRVVVEAAAAGGIPKLVDLGADKCIPCKMMAPILGQLKKDYAGRMDVEFIDVWKNPSAAAHYGVRSIPTQIFYDASGKELRRHVGFISRDDILKTWQEIAVEFPAADTAEG